MDIQSKSRRKKKEVQPEDNEDRSELEFQKEADRFKYHEHEYNIDNSTVTVLLGTIEKYETQRIIFSKEYLSLEEITDNINSIHAFIGSCYPKSFVFHKYYIKYSYNIITRTDEAEIYGVRNMTKSERYNHEEEKKKRVKENELKECKARAAARRRAVKKKKKELELLAELKKKYPEGK